MKPHRSADLAGLRRELEEMEISERPSFGPELLGELERTWQREGLYRRDRRPGLPLRRLALATAAGFLLALVVVPDARAGFLRWMGSPTSDTARSGDLPWNGPMSAFIPAPAPAGPDLADQDRAAAAAEALSPPPAPGPPAGEVPFVPSRVSYPELRDRAAARSMVQRFYPRNLMADGVAGTVRLQFWVDEAGEVFDPSVVASSGVSGLDQAALVAAPYLRFYPATDRGRPVGTYVEFELHFTGEPEGSPAVVAPLTPPELPDSLEDLPPRG